ncbi:amidase signature enzyme [Schizopora paradoxa]|uniref:amidase n=1 Tax=Schizopora paradoxa TaxID=27342 RepID=A0A0H2RD30_9AGAM|nr:amidase signature enzyme [Schizopora paradoxa]
MVFAYWKHLSSCRLKQRERDERIEALPKAYREPLSDEDVKILESPISTLRSNVQNGTWTTSRVLLAFGRQALRAHKRTNCLTEVMISSAEEWAPKANLSGPLAGVPVSLKDSFSVAGWDACIGYSAWVGKTMQKDSPLVRLLRDAGAILYVKTTIPITLLSFESASDVFGRTTNPHNSKYSAGGSSGGEAALIASGGSRVGLGTDVAGSVRVPSHYSGIYTIKASHQRFPKYGNMTSIPGQEGVAATCSPMARSLDDLETFWKAVFEMKPWDYDHLCLEIPWRGVELPKKIKFGIMWDDGVVPASPACNRAVVLVRDSLKSMGHEVVDFTPPDPYEGLKIASQLILADAGKTVLKPIRRGEWNDPGMVNARKWFTLPSIFKTLYVWWVRYVKRDEIYAGLLEGWREKTMEEYLALVARRNSYQGLWFETWKAAGIDFLISAPNALPAVPHDGMREGFKACGYSFLFNMLDYSAGVLPVTKVDKALDALDPQIAAQILRKNAVARGAYKLYDAEKMHGLPVGVQVVGKKLQEEKVLEGMKIVETALRQNGCQYTQLSL